MVNMSTMKKVCIGLAIVAIVINLAMVGFDLYYIIKGELDSLPFAIGSLATATMLITTFIILAVSAAKREKH